MSFHFYERGTYEAHLHTCKDNKSKYFTHYKFINNYKNIMKMIKNSLVMFLTIVFSVGVYAPALALEAGVSTEVSATAVRYSDGKEVSQASTSASVKMEASATMKDDSNHTSTTTWERKGYASTTATSTATSTKERHESEADEHRSAVSMFVHNLLKVADREGGIGKEVRVIAHEQNDSGTTTAESIAKVETRSSFKKFLLGSDYKSLGVIRSELAKGDNRISRLMAIASSTTDVTIKAQLVAQIKLWQDDQAKVTAFVNANENNFSLLGWFVKLFNK